MSTRRDFLSQAVAVGTSLAAIPATAQDDFAASSVPLRILMLGGTGNIGLYHAREALARGHHVSVFSRGITQANLPPGVERLIGDRNGNLESIMDRDWDAVIDLATYGPGWVRSLGEAIRDRTKHYTFISTISVYDDPAANRQTDEDDPVLSYDGSADPYSIVDEGQYYGALKVLCEREAERQFPNRTVVLRPGFIGGPDETHGVLTYWAARAEVGGEILAAGERSTPVQYIDVRDLAQWVVRLVERSVTGTYNTLSSIYGLDQIIDAAAQAAPTPPKVTWVSSEWLAKQNGQSMWGTLLFWKVNEGYLTRISNARALANGLVFRPLRVTLSDTLAWYKQQPAESRATLNTGFQMDPDTGDFIQVRTPWPAYLDREKEVLAARQTELAKQRRVDETR